MTRMALFDSILHVSAVRPAPLQPFTPPPDKGKKKKKKAKDAAVWDEEEELGPPAEWDPVWEAWENSSHQELTVPPGPDDSCFAMRTREDLGPGKMEYLIGGVSVYQVRAKRR